MRERVRDIVREREREGYSERERGREGESELVDKGSRVTDGQWEEVRIQTDDRETGKPGQKKVRDSNILT